MYSRLRSCCPDNAVLSQLSLVFLSTQDVKVIASAPHSGQILVFLLLATMTPPMLYVIRKHHRAKSVTSIYAIRPRLIQNRGSVMPETVGISQCCFFCFLDHMLLKLLQNIPRSGRCISS
ncbi:unknown protein [Desulfotalea psychrophila LSv54]|uniref:Uncharacterized protein n=1 Tax=Desulfotalea psychrophila (strain LSv54 / DSM 12343) TaxID=177439 RepID=Q6ALF8_DESPS|nr:unknown protein [Desulfotalea psychrophila LSv54]